MSGKNLLARGGGVVAVLVAILAVAGAQAQTNTATPETPAIEQTEPACWSREVPVETTALEVTFDAPFGHGSRTVATPSPLVANHPAALLPASAGEARATDGGRTITLPFKLEPGRVYVMPLLPEGAAVPGPVTTVKPGGTAMAQSEMRARFVVFQTAGDPRPEQEPPQIIAVELRHGSAPGNAKEPLPPTQLKITFDRDMNPATHGFILTQNDEPLAVTQVVYDKKTRTWQATFPTRAGIVTARLNSESNVGFRAADPVKIPAWPVQLSFQVPFQGSLRQTPGAVRTNDD